MKPRPFWVLQAVLSAGIFSALSAQTPGTTTIDFDDGNNPFSDGVISTDQAASGTNSLYLGADDYATFSIPAEYAGENIVISMKIYDQGLWIDRENPGFPGTAWGPRWGVGTNPSEGNTYVAGAISERTFSGGNFLSSTGYSTHPANGQAFNAGTWFTVYGYSNSGAVRAPLLGDGGGNDGGFWDPPQPGPGMWTQWNFTVLANGDTTFGMEGLPLVVQAGGPLYNIGGGATGIYLYGGGSSDGFGALAGVWVDDVMIGPAPDDILPPTIPDGLAFENVTDTSVDLSWNASTDAEGVLGYYLYTNGGNPVTLTETSTTVEGLTPGETYTFTVSAFDATGNESAPSAGIDVTTTGSVGMTINFDDDVNPFSGGTISTDHAASGSNSLYLGNRESASFELPAEYQDASVVITMEVLDRGVWIDNDVEGRPGSAYGPRWGVGNAQTAINYVAAAIVHKGFLPSNAGYSIHNVSAGDDFAATNWWSPAFFSGTERAILSDDGGSNPGSGWVPGTAVDVPVWTKWTFTVTVAGDVSVDFNAIAENSSNNITGPASSIYLYGGNEASGSADALTGLYIDNITVSLAPADEEPPTIPANLVSSNVGETTVDLAWDPASDNIGVASYNVYIDGEDPINGPSNSATIAGLTPGKTYTFTVTALDADGNESEPSEGVTVTMALPIGLSIDFDDETNPFSAGTLSMDFAATGTHSLYLGNRETATFSLPEDFQDTDVIITMQVLDLGLWVDPAVDGSPSNAYGPRWAVGNSTEAANYVAGTIIHKGFLPSSAGYGMHQVSSGDSFGATSWFSPSFYTSSERAVLSDDGGSNPGSGWVPGVAADTPVWTEWTFVVEADGNLSVELGGYNALTGNNIGGPASTIYLYGGNDGSSSQNALTGLYIDNITLTAIPGDLEPPEMVTGLTVSDLSDTSLQLSWDASTDDTGVVGYKIISDPDLGELIVTETSVVLTDLDSETEYTFTVVALDEAGNESDASDPVTVTTKITVPDYAGPDYYVDPENGSIDGNGSMDFPWSTLQEVFEAGKTFAAGDTLYLMDGHHGYPVIDGMNSDYVYIMPADDAEPQATRLRFADTSSYWDVRGLDVSPSYAEFYELGTIVGISGSHNVFADSMVHSVPDISGWGLTEWLSRAVNGIGIGASDSLVENCTVMNIYHGISASASAVSTVVRGNTIQNFGGDGMRGLGDNQVFEYNFVADCYNIDDNHDDGFQSWTDGPDGIGSSTVYGITLRGNMIVQQTDPERTEFLGPLQAIGCFDGMYEGWLIENNVIITNHFHGITLMGAVNCRFLNNTVVDIDPAQTRPWIQVSNHKNGTPPSGNLVRNNLTTTLNTGQDATAVVDHNYVITAGEYGTMFQGHPYDLRLRDAVPVLDAGSNALTPSIDIEGFERPFDGDWDGIAVTDIGAYEHASDWVNHVEMGWLFTGYVEDTANMWIYSLYLNGWAWSSDSLWPILYDWNNSRYVYYFMVEGVGVWLYDYATRQWTLNP